MDEAAATPAGRVAVDEYDLPAAGRGGVRLFRRSARPAPGGPPVWARLAVLPGYGDHAGRYEHVLRWLAARGVAADALDFRGHGRAGGRRGFVVRWDEYLDDLDVFLNVLNEPESGGVATLPLFLLGQSHGCLVICAAAVQGRLDRVSVAGTVLCSPYLGSRIVVPPATERLARIADRLVPWLPVPSKVASDWLYEDAVLRALDAADTLANRTATPRWYLSTLRVQAETRARAEHFRLPVLLVLGEADPMSDLDAARAFAERAGSTDKTVQTYAGYRHETLRESGRETVLTDILAWLRARVPPT